MVVVVEVFVEMVVKGLVESMVEDIFLFGSRGVVGESFDRLEKENCL